LSANISDVCSPVSPVGLSVDFPHGGGVEEAARAWQCKTSDILDLSTGLHPAGPPVWLGAWLNEHAGLIGQYPDRNGEPARSSLAKELCVKPKNILITAGAQAAIEVVFQAMCWRSMSIHTPCYNEPIRCARRAGCIVLPFEIGAPPAADVFWMTSPSNPTGEREWPLNDASHPSSGRICLDESYMPFSQRRNLGLMSDVIRIGSLTKIFSIPGLRLGYVIADKETIEQLNHWLPPWPASTLALHVLPKLLLEADLRDGEIMAARARLQALLEMTGWRVRPSAASFLMAQREQGSLPNFASRRILVRQFHEWPQLTGWIRFGLPGYKDGWQRLEEALCR